MFTRAMLQRSQQLKVTPLKSWFALTSTPMRTFASKLSITLFKNIPIL